MGTTFGNLVSTRFGTAASSTNTYSQAINSIAYDALGNEYQFVEYDNSSSVSAVPGCPLGYTSADEGSTVTTDISKASLVTAGIRLCGVAMCSLGPTNKYGWMLTRCNNLAANTTLTSAGAVLKLKTSTNVVASERLVWNADKVFEGTAASVISLSRMSAGLALTDDSGSILDKAVIWFAFA